MISFDDMKAGKLNTRSEVADQLLPDLLGIAQDPAITATIDPALIPLLRRAVDVLENWNRRADSDSTGTLLFHEFLASIGKEFGDETDRSMGVVGENAGGFRIPLDDAHPLETPRGFANPVHACTGT